MTQPRLLIHLSEEDLETMVRRAAEAAVKRAFQAQQMTAAKAHLTIRETADLLRCSEDKIRRLIKRGGLASTKVNDGGSSRILIARTDVEATLAKSTT